MQSKPKALPVTWIVVVRCNLDDVIVGAYPLFQQARARMNHVLKQPKKEVTSHPQPVRDRWDDSGMIAVAIYRARGSEVENYLQQEIGDEAEAA